MGSKKRSAEEKRRAAFESELGEMDDIFAQENLRQERRAQEREASLRKKACESKNRYAFRSEAEAARVACADHGTTGLHIYQCPYCKGWHLTSKPQE